MKRNLFIGGSFQRFLNKSLFCRRFYRYRRSLSHRKAIGSLCAASGSLHRGFRGRSLTDTACPPCGCAPTERGVFESFLFPAAVLIFQTAAAGAGGVAGGGGAGRIGLWLGIRLAALGRADRLTESPAATVWSSEIWLPFHGACSRGLPSCGSCCSLPDTERIAP